MRARALRIVLIFVMCAVWCSLGWADAGVLLPMGKEAPDASVLSIAELRVEVRIDNGDARVRMVEIFANHTGQVQEGTFQFALPDGSTVSDFAVWDGPVRIPAVVLERKRAEEVYIQARNQAIDPGLLQMGERTDDPATNMALFTAKIAPIPAWGTKRVEMEYHQQVRVSNLASVFVLPLKPSAFGKQVAERFSLAYEQSSAMSLADFALDSKSYAVKFGAQDTHAVKGSFEAQNFSLDEDFVAKWSVPASEVDALHVIAYRSQKVPLPQADERSPEAAGVQPGFFEAQVVVGDGGASASADAKAKAGAPRTVVVLMDTSLSMQWDKLERSFAALEAVLHGLRPVDRFDVLTFNQDVVAWKPAPLAADAGAVAAALDFVRGGKLRGGTDLGKALAAGLKQCDADPCTLVVLTDGGSDRGATVLPGKIAAAFAAQWKAAAHRPRTAVFAVGDDAHVDLLRLLARNNGMMEHVTSSEPVEYKLRSFADKLSRDEVKGLVFTAPAQARMVYPLQESVFTGSDAAWVGQYGTPGTGAAFAVSGDRGGKPLAVKGTSDLPSVAEEHVQLPRLWAQARVNALLAQIAEDGETRAAVDEIIRLSRRYKFVTPYTSFLAVPRSLLRPRVIRPGDPVLRVRTDPAIESVVALFPFGLTKPLRHLSDEDTSGPEGGRLWETRFLAPAEMKDGTYSVRLLLRDRKGNTYRENKTFVIASTPPTVRVTLASATLHRGERVKLRAAASSSTRTLTARLNGAGFASLPVSLQWDRAAGASVGEMAVPGDVPAGRYTLVVTAEDIAHNVGTQEVSVDVLP